MSQCTYEKIRNLHGAGELFEIVRKWDIISENLSEKTPRDSPMILPNLLWSAKSGSGTSKAVDLMVDYLVKKGNLMEFSGNVKAFQFKLAYVPPSLPFKELQRLSEAILHAKGFRCHFKGIIVIDINEWKNHFEEEYFTDFLHFISDNSCKCLIVFSITSNDNKFLDNLEGFLSLFLRIERVDLKSPDVKELVGFCVRYLAGHGISLRKNAVRLIEESLSKMQESVQFDGYNAATRLCQDIRYSLLSHNNTNEKIGASAIKEFQANSEYIRKRTISVSSSFDKRIGFKEK